MACHCDWSMASASFDELKALVLQQLQQQQDGEDDEEDDTAVPIEAS
jgi:hypothetical protein